MRGAPSESSDGALLTPGRELLLALGRMSWDPRMRTYVARRTADGLSKPEILRCPERYLARELYQFLAGHPAALPCPSGQAPSTAAPIVP